MNQVRYANLKLLFQMLGTPISFQKESKMVSVFAGMWTLTLLTKEGFSGYKKLQEEETEWLVEEAKKAVARALKEKNDENNRRDVDE